jgi:DNA invertase Pin-like site-specific DNA recombinase
MRAAIYARVSTDEQHVDQQLNELRGYCFREGLEVVAEFADHGESGAHSDREQFVRMFRAAERKEFDVLVFWALDRFSREGVLVTFEHLARLKGYGVDWISHQEEFFSKVGDFKDMFVALFATLARSEHKRMSERVKMGWRRALLKGIRPGPRSTLDDAEVLRRWRAGEPLLVIAEAFGKRSAMTAWKAKERALRDEREARARLEAVAS